MIRHIRADNRTQVTHMKAITKGVIIRRKHKSQGDRSLQNKTGNP